MAVFVMVHSFNSKPSSDRVISSRVFLDASGSVLEVEMISDLPFVERGDRQLCLDLYLPKGVENPPLLISIFGGGWRSGNRNGPPSASLLQAGYAVAKIEYRLSQVAKFPAQIHDCKAALRWLRAHASEYGYDAARVAVMGSSAGGHLSLLLGFTADDPRYDHEGADHSDQSTRVSAIVDFFGPADFILRSQDQPSQTEDPEGRVYQLLGGPVQQNLEMARLASPSLQVTSDVPPVLIFHGSADSKVFMNQSESLRDTLLQAGVPVELHVVEGAGHGGPDYDTPENWASILKFLGRTL
jgi:acetyl esterase/lipase